MSIDKSDIDFYERNIKSHVFDDEDNEDYGSVEE